IAAVRLSCACPIHPRQRGFICTSNCSENLKLLQLLVKSAEQEHCHLGVVCVDIAKAFDTVSHQHVIVGLTERRVDPHIVHLVSEMYRGITTYIV
ncbi:POLR protein, partial [Sylvia atricapilla]|nr:POLR protein [Sylvia atricapilla]